MTGKRRVWGLLILAGVLLAGAVAVALAQQKAPEPPEPPMPPEEPFIVLGGGAWLGVSVSDVNADKVRELRLPGEYGALVERVVEESPAAKAGLQKDDVIVSFAGERVRSAAQLTRLVRETPAGRKVALEVVRGGQTRAVEVTVERRRAGAWVAPEIHVAPRVEVAPRFEIAPMPPFEAHMFTRGPRLGISADEISGQLAEYFGVKQGRGVLVKEVMEGSAAAKGGLKAGDVIVRVNDKEIGDIDDLRRALRESEKQATVTIVRDRREQTLKVELEEPAAPRAPRRAAELDIHLDTEELARQAEGLAQELEHKLHGIEAETQRYFESKEFQDQMRAWEDQLRAQEQQLRERFDSQKFRDQMRELERQMKQLERELRVI